MTELGRVDLAVQHLLIHSEKSAQPLEIAAEREPVLLGRAVGEPVGDRGEIELVEQASVDELDLVRVEVRRGAAEGREVESLRQLGPGWRSGSTGCEVPIRASTDSSAIGSTPSSRRCSAP